MDNCFCKEIYNDYQSLRDEIDGSIDLSIDEKLELKEDYDRYEGSDRRDCENRFH